MSIQPLIPSTSESTATARGILFETIIEKADVFKDPNRWISIQDFRADIIHPFDVERLLGVYKNPTEAWQAMILALGAFPWIETRNNGINTEFRVNHYPNTLPRDLGTAVQELRQLRTLLTGWKDVGQQLVDLTEATHAMRLTVTHLEQLLHRTAALAFYYRSRHLEFCKARGIAYDDDTSIDPNPMILEAILADPSKFSEVKVMQRTFGLLTDEALEDAVEDASN